MTHTEHTHILFGFLTALFGVGAFWSGLHPTSWTRYLAPGAAFLLGFFLFIPVERHTRTYLPVGWWQTIFSAFPGSVAEWQRYLPDWIAKLNMMHVVQHKLTGVAGMVWGVVGWGQVSGRLSSSGLRWALPIVLVATGAALGIHGGTAEHLPHAVEVLHHRIYGVCFLAGGVSLALVEFGWLGPRWRLAWPSLTIAAGIDLMLFYRLT